MTLPARLRTHTITVEPRVGVGPSGAVYGAPVLVTCHLEDELQLVRDSTGAEVVSSATVFCDLDVTIPPESRITIPERANIPERVTTVISVAVHDTDGRSALEHLEVALK